MTTSLPANMLSDPMEILLTSDLWGTRQIIDASSGLTPEQFGRSFEMGLGTLQKTLVHMASAMYRWGDVLGGKTPRTALDVAMFPTPKSLLPAFEEASALLRAQAAARPLSDVVERDLGGRVYRFSRAIALLQITTHGNYHRAQCVNMLRHLGVSPVPDPSVMVMAMKAQ